MMSKKYRLPASILFATISFTAANAAEQTQLFNIPSQSLSSALSIFSAQTALTLDVDSTQLINKTSHAVYGVYSPVQALELLLSESNIHAGSLTTNGHIPLIESDVDDTIIVSYSPTHITRTMEISSQQLDAAGISKMPQTNNSITGLLKTNPNVQYANANENSTSPGEIAPETISFHGEKFYNNNFVIDGLSNNDRLNPGQLTTDFTTNPTGYSPNDMPTGHPEAFWIPSNLLESVSVFDSNISAKYGQFTGGVVDAKLKEPLFTEASGSVSWRSSRDSWVKYHIDESKKAQFEQATILRNQPKFTKNFYSINVSQPLSDNAGIMFAYTRQESTIPYWQNILQRWDDQERLSETYLIKGTWQADENNRYNLTLMYSPHSSTFVRKNIIHSDFSSEGGGYNINWQWLNHNHLADVKTQIAWKVTENSIKDHKDMYTWKNSTPSINWSSSGTNAQEGGYGNRETEQHSLLIKQDWDFVPLSFWHTNHEISTGFDIDISKAKYQRKEDSYNYYMPLVNSAVVCQDSGGCINGEQYTSQRLVYGKENTSVNANTYGIYLQDQINWSGLTITPGIRIDYDDYLQNINISPRLAAIYDVFGNSETELFGGINRYYAGNILAYKLREARIGAYLEKRAINADGTLTDWTWSKNNTIANKYRYSVLDTPYSDEINLGFRQQLFDTVWTAKWVYRKGKDQFSRSETKDSDGYYYMTNEGKSSSNTYRLTIEPVSPISWQSLNISWLVGGSITRNHSSNSTYDDGADDEIVMYKNKLTSKLGLPAADYNRPWTAFVEINTAIPDWYFDWTNRLSLIGPYSNLGKIGTINCATDNRCGTDSGTYDEYGEVRYNNTISWDWRFTYAYPTFNKQKLIIGLDVINVLDRTNQLSKDSYSLGRQFWLDVTYSW